MIDVVSQLPVLVVVTPLFGGLLCTFTGRGWLPWLWALGVSGTVLMWAYRLMEQVRTAQGGVVDYFIGWWPSEYGIAYRVDTLNASVILVVAWLGFLSTIYAKRSVDAEIPKDRHNLFFAVWLLSICGMIGITVTGDAFNVYVLLEIGALTSYSLIAMGHVRDRRALTASLKYLIMGSIGATFLLIGIGYLLMLTGTLNMADMNEQLLGMKERGELAGNRTAMVGFTFVIVGLGLKMAMFPLHMWLPNAYTFAPSAVSVLMAATATKVGVYMALRFIFTVWGGVYDPTDSLDFVLLLAAAGVIVSGVQAARCNDAKKVLAYSSVGQLGYIALGFALFNQAGMTSAVIHIINHALIKGGMFMALGCVALRLGGTQLSQLKGLGRRMPFTMAAFIIGGFGLVGMPLTSGFVSKWYLVAGAMERGYLWVALVVLIGSALALIYMWRMIELIYFRESDSKADIREAPLSMLIPTWILIGTSIYFGIDASLTVDLASTAAALLVPGASP